MSFVIIVFISYVLQCCVDALAWSSWSSFALVQFCVTVFQLVVVCLMFLKNILNTTEFMWLCMCVLEGGRGLRLCMSDEV